MSTLEIPRTLPGGLRSLSYSSIMKYLRCPEQWRQTYIENKWEPTGGPAVLGKAVHAANAEYFRHKLDGVLLAESDYLDAYADAFEAECEEAEVAWRDDTPAALKDAGVPLVKRYAREVAPPIMPVAVEREFRVQPDGVDWYLKGFIDLETSQSVCDYKVVGRAMSQADMDSSLQPTMYLLARRAEGMPTARFDYHVLNRGVKTPSAQVKVADTQRTDAQMDAFYRRILGVAAEIAWRAEHDHWQGAVPGSWWCNSKWCGFWQGCPYGGA